MQLGTILKSFLGILVIALSQNALAKKVITDREPLGKGYVYSWVEVQERPHKITALGLTITGSAMSSLPEHLQEIVLEPKNHQLPPFKHFTVDWNPHGHDPLNIYGTPHFDFHFYMITHQQRHIITCTDVDAAICTKPIPPAMIPSDYVPTPAGVPMMGWHWVDAASPEFNGFPFTHTMIYGYYNGKMIFIEPMVALDYFESKPNVAIPIKEPIQVATTGWYPKTYLVYYHPVLDTYSAVLTNFFKRYSVR